MVGPLRGPPGLAGMYPVRLIRCGSRCTWPAAGGLGISMLICQLRDPPATMSGSILSRRPGSFLTNGGGNMVLYIVAAFLLGIMIGVIWGGFFDD